MKRLLMVTLLLLIASAFISCNSYDVEGKPEVASNPAKKVFSNYPWDGTVTDTTPVDDDSEVSDDTAADNEVIDDADADEVVADEVVTDDVATDDDTTAVVSLKATIPENITQEFEVYNRGVTGTLKIFKINVLDPDGNAIAASTNKNYQNLFKIQIQKTLNGIVQEGWNEKVLTFDNQNAVKAKYIASLCPLDLNNTTADRKCKKSFPASEYNSQFKILLSYNKSAAEALKKTPPADLKVAGDFSIEICTNDPSKQKTGTCGDFTSYKIQVTRQPVKPPKPVIKVLFEYTTGGVMSYRNIKDKVSMNLKNTCVSDPDQPEDSNACLPDVNEENTWKNRYYIKYKWEMSESPTPLIPESQIELPDSSGFAGQWLPFIDDSGDNPKRAEFTGLMITPRRYAENNTDYNETTCTTKCGKTEPANDKDEFYFLDLSNYLMCRQKYCEKYKTKYYKINIQAETVDKQTDLVSDTAEVTVLPKIIPQARVVAQLTWQEGYKTKNEATSNKDGTMVDIDIHLIKRTSLEAPTYGYTPLEGVLGTNEQPTDGGFDPNNPEHERYFRHDDCSFSDQGVQSAEIAETIAWHASLDIDNIWGGNNFETPETIGLGPIEDTVASLIKDTNNDQSYICASDSDCNAAAQCKSGEVKCKCRRGKCYNGTPDGIPDDSIMDDQYLVVVGYVNCTPQYADKKNTCDPTNANYSAEDSVYEAHARVEILVDGVDAPRPERIQNGNPVRPADNYSVETKDFTIKYGEWKVIAVVKWDGTLPSPESNPKYPGDGIVSDIAMADEDITTDAKGYKTCEFDYTDAVLVPVWDETAYYGFVEAKRDPLDEQSESIGKCY